MALDPEQLAQLQRAYEILGVPSTASALQIKRAYRKLTRRWHPDLYTAGSQEQADATQMMKIINEAYDQVATAPLRYYDPRKQTTQTREREPYVQQPQPVVIFPHDRHEPPQNSTSSGSVFGSSSERCLACSPLSEPSCAFIT